MNTHFKIKQKKQQIEQNKGKTKKQVSIKTNLIWNKKKTFFLEREKKIFFGTRKKK